MGSQERAAYDACAAALELAFASGELSVGARGWRTKRVDIVNRWLTGRPEIPVSSPADGARRERHLARAASAPNASTRGRTAGRVSGHGWPAA